MVRSWKTAITEATDVTPQPHCSRSEPHQFDPNSWVYYKPNHIEIGILVGSFGVFFTLFLLFVKILPAVAIAEIKEQVRPPLKREEVAA